jgi:heterodisulfide reductase subunit C
MVHLGMIRELLESKVIWECAQCLACKERCPRNVSPYDVIQTLQNLSFKNNLTFPKGYSKMIDSILKNGIIKDPVKVGAWKKIQKGETERGEREFQNRSTLNLPHLKRPAEVKKFARSLKIMLQGKEK